MSTAAVICEFNPFHNGHKFLLEKIKKEYADHIVCIMSGSFVQRGDIAITDKFSRAREALQHGADMVVELPTVYALSPAQIFAQNGVRIAKELRCEMLCFGAENSIEELKETIAALDCDDTQKEIAAKMQSGGYYPKALSDSLDEKYAAIISKPNNILAIEYIRACETYGITPVAIERKGVNHDSPTVSGEIASASKIREMIAAGEDYTPFSPVRISRVYSLRDIEPILLYQLKTQSPDEIAAIAGVGEGLNNRISQYAQQYNSIEEILSAVKTKRYTMARLRRIALCITLGITDEMQHTPVPYLRVLGVRRGKESLIQAERLPLIVDVRRGYDALDNSAKEIFDVDLAATQLTNSAKVSPAALNDFLQGVIKL